MGKKNSAQKEVGRKPGEVSFCIVSHYRLNGWLLTALESGPFHPNYAFVWIPSQSVYVDVLQDHLIVYPFFSHSMIAIASFMLLCVELRIVHEKDQLEPIVVSW